MSCSNTPSTLRNLKAGSISRRRAVASTAGVILGILATAAPASAQLTLSVVGASGGPGDVVRISFILSGDADGTAVSADADLRFDDDILELVQPLGENCSVADRLASTHQIGRRLEEPGLLIVAVFPFLPPPFTPLRNGELMSCSFRIKQGAPLDTGTGLLLEVATVSDEEGDTRATQTGNATIAIVAPPVEDSAYVTTTDGIALVDTRSNRQVATIGLPESPVYLALAPNRGTLYATAETATVYAVDTRSRTLRGSIPGDPRFAGVAFSPNASIVYALRSRFLNNPVSSIALIDPLRLSIFNNIPIFEEPLATEVVTRVVVGPDGRKAYVPLTFAAGDRFDITVVDLDRARVETTIPIPCGETMIDLAFAPNVPRLYVPVLAGANCRGTRTAAGAAVCSGDCNNNAQVTVDELILGVRIALGEIEIDACRAVSGGDDTVAISDLLRAVNSLLSGCDQPPMPDGDFTAVIDTEQQVLFNIIDLGSASTGRLNGAGAAGIASMASGLGIAISPDGDFAYVTRCGNGVCVLDLASNKVVGSIAVRGLPYNIDLARDGRTAYVTELASERIFVLDVERGVVIASIAIPQSTDVVLGH